MGVRLIERFLSIIWLYSIQDGSSTTLWLRFCFCSPYNRMVLTFKLHQKKKTDKKGGYAAQILDPKNQKSWFRSPNPYMFNTLQKFLKYQSVHKFLCSRQTSSRSLKKLSAQTDSILFSIGGTVHASNFRNWSKKVLMLSIFANPKFEKNEMVSSLIFAFMS